jgi:hypothetical protein
MCRTHQAQGEAEELPVLENVAWKAKKILRTRKTYQGDA